MNKHPSDGASLDEIVLTEEERLAFVASLREAERDIADGNFTRYAPRTFVERLRAIRQVRLNARRA